MAHRTIRLSISPEDMPEVRRVIDFDGRNSLHDVHELMLETLSVGDGDHLYAFFLSGNYWDTSTEYVDPRTEGPRADRALLFRLQLRVGQHFVYVYDYGSEQRYSLSVVSVTETNVPLSCPVLIESVGEAPSRFEDWDVEASDKNEESDDSDESEENDDSDENEASEGARDPALQKPLELATAVVEQLESLAALGENASSEQTQPLLHELGESALSFLRELAGNLQLLATIDREFEPELIQSLLGIPGRLAEGRQTDLAVRVAEALKFCALDDMNGEIAIAYARAGDRQRALELVLTNLETAAIPYIAEYKSGDVYVELGEPDAAEAYYRRALAIADTPANQSEAMLRVASHLIRTGREAEAAAFITQQRGLGRAPARNAGAQLPAVGRNEPCPCGSGKKYKKCHGA